MYSNADDWNVIRDCHEKSMRRDDSPWSSRAAIRKAVGMKSRIHFIRYYIAPMLEKGLIACSAPDHPQSQRQEYSQA